MLRFRRAPPKVPEEPAEGPRTAVKEPVKVRSLGKGERLVENAVFVVDKPLAVKYMV
jgi:hypothetical protein